MRLPCWSATIQIVVGKNGTIPTNKATAEHLVNIVSLFLIPYISPIIAHKGIPTGIIVRNQMSIL